MVPMQRSAGVLLHPTCLPSPHGIGDLGSTAHAYLDWLADAAVGWWQILPLNPPGPGHSPYSATSTFAGNTLLISPQALVDDGLLDADDLADAPAMPDEWVDYSTVGRWKRTLLARAFERFQTTGSSLTEDHDRFVSEHRAWIDDFALFSAIKDAHGGAPWTEWPEPLARRERDAIATWRREHKTAIARETFAQYLFHRQWALLREHAADVGVSIIGDVPIFVALDSAEVWAHPELFMMDQAGRPAVVAGVPPDYFSPTGQLWGNPLYDWDRMAADGYRWWIDRLKRTLDLVDLVRLDHFRGFAAHWEVPADAATAEIGRWAPGPGQALFDAIAAELGALPFIAEDLGQITADVVELRRTLDLPGMAILHFAFSPEPRSSYIPYAHTPSTVVYTGTHDNNTSLGWFLEDASDAERALLLSYTGTDGSEIHWDLIRLALGSVADLAVIPHQDLAGLGADCRMNTPAVADGNWTFRLMPWMLDREIQDRLAGMISTYGRTSRIRG